MYCSCWICVFLVADRGVLSVGWGAEGTCRKGEWRERSGRYIEMFVENE